MAGFILSPKVVFRRLSPSASESSCLEWSVVGFAGEILDIRILTPKSRLCSREGWQDLQASCLGSLLQSSQSDDGHTGREHGLHRQTDLRSLGESKLQSHACLPRLWDAIVGTTLPEVLCRTHGSSPSISQPKIQAVPKPTDTAIAWPRRSGSRPVQGTGW